MAVIVGVGLGWIGACEAGPVRFTTTEIAAATGGVVLGDAVEVDGVTTDSRAARPGQLFVPIVAARDGHDFIGLAMSAGATAYLTSRDADVGPGVRVADTTEALARLGRAARDRLPERVIGITGSVGKTSVKDLTRAALADWCPTTASEKSFNNELGLPTTLCNAPGDTRAVVLEMGMRGFGHIAHLCEIGRPTVGVVTVVGYAHTEVVGGLEGVAKAKGELVEALPASGTAVLAAAQPLVMAMAQRTPASVLTFGDGAGDVRAEGVELDADLHPTFRLVTPWGSAEVRLGVSGRHNAANAAAAAAAALSVGAPLADVAAGLGRAHLSAWRMELHHAPNGAVVLNDAYNANPNSMRVALEALAALDARRRVAVLGLMAELGPDGPAQHAEMADLAERLGIDVVAVDTPLYGRPVVEGVEGALEQLRRRGLLGAGDAVLVKASRVAGLERLAARLLEPTD